MTILTGIAVPFIQRPMLGYEDIGLEDIKQLIVNNQKITEYILKIKNLGFVKLTNVVGSLNLTTNNFSTDPKFPDSILTTDFNDSNTFFKVSVLPPQSEISVKLQTNSSDLQTSIPVPLYVASDEWVGYPSWYIILINLIASIIAGVLIYYSIKLLRRY